MAVAGFEGVESYAFGVGGGATNGGNGVLGMGMEGEEFERRGGLTFGRRRSRGLGSRGQSLACIYC